MFQIRRVEALGEPAVDRRKEVAALGVTALVAAESGEAHRKSGAGVVSKKAGLARSQTRLAGLYVGAF